MRELGKILVVSQHYPPDPTTTATYIGEIARALATERRVVVLSGSPSSATSGSPEVIEIAGAARIFCRSVEGSKDMKSL